MLPTAIKRLEGCVEELRAAGNQATLRPETMGKSAMLGSLDDTLKMSQAIEGVEPCLDFAHLHSRTGDGSMNSYDEWSQTLEDYGKALGRESLKRLSTHLSGIEYTEKGEKNHLPMEESDFNLEALLKALKAFDCAGRLLCESPIMEDDALLFQKKWMEISGETIS